MSGTVVLLAAAAGLPDDLKQLRYINSGVVRSSDVYALHSVPSIYNEGYSYMGTGSYAYNARGLEYLYKTAANGSVSTPPSGMRSSVPLGGLGEGSVELRADGRLADWREVFNNGPYVKGGQKLDADETAFGVGVQRGSDFGGVLLRTHPGAGLPASDSLTYSGAYPTARLAAGSSVLEGMGVGVTLTAFSEFEAHNPWNSAAPLIFFSLTLRNTGKSSAVVSALFNIEDVIGGGSFAASPSGVTVNNAGDLSKSGNLSAVVVQCDGCSSKPAITVGGGKGLSDVWTLFEAGKGSLPGLSANASSAGVSASASVGAGQEVTMTFALTWFYPHRVWGQTDLGHFYQNNYTSSLDVSQKRGARVEDTLKAALSWQALCYNTTLPDAFKDAFVNTPPTWGKTAMWLKDGRWRQFESHSCAQMEPPHIHFYRALGYELFAPQLERNTPELYAKDLVAKGGDVLELFGCGCGGCQGVANCDLDGPKGSTRGDDTPVFVLDVYMQWKWGADDTWVAGAKWEAVARGLQFIMDKAPAPYYLPYQMVNTNDEHGVIGDLNTYNAFIFLSAMAACDELATAAGNKTLVGLCATALEKGRESLRGNLWNEGGFWTQAWCEDTPSTRGGGALQGGGLYGFLWANVLGLAEKVGMNESDIVSHLDNERERLLSPYGLKFATNRSVDYYHGCPKSGKGVGTGFIDDDVWASHSFTHAAVSLFTGGDEGRALEIAETVLNAYQNVVNDQWDFRDTMTQYTPKGAFDPTSSPTPSVNSHYARQTIWWSLPMALSGQQYDRRAGVVSFSLATSLLSPNTDGEAGSPFAVLLPEGSAVGRMRADGCITLAGTSGALPLPPAVGYQWRSREGGEFVTLKTEEGAGELVQGQNARLCPERQ